jgi:hypothetical protein
MADEYICNPKDLHFTQESIKDSFSKAHSGVKLQDTVADIKGRMVGSGARTIEGSGWRGRPAFR